MIKLLITLTIICFTLGVKAQSDSTATVSNIGIFKYTGSFSNQSGKIRILYKRDTNTGWIKFPNYNIRDTLKCWFKEAKEITNDFGYPIRSNGVIIMRGQSVI